MKNYQLTECGALKQINYKKFKYDLEYNQAYNKHGELGKRMSYLRLGYVLGAIGNHPNSILDVGPGNGDFIKTCKEVISEVKYNDIIQRPDLEGFEYIEDITKQEVDVITFFDSLEHFHDLDFISDLNAKFVVISMPCCAYPSNEEYVKSYKHFKPDEHIWHFSPEALVKFMVDKQYLPLCLSNIEDSIRKPETDLPNIMTAIFVNKRKAITATTEQE
jgi:hypothetical protein